MESGSTQFRSVKSTSVAKTTAKISLPDIITLLISKIKRKHQTEEEHEALGELTSQTEN